MQSRIEEIAEVAPRDAEGVAHIVGLSGGKDSTCMALALREKEPRPYTYVYTPTGDELPEMDAHMRKIESIIRQPVWRITNGTLAAQTERKKALPNSRMRWCTPALKLKPFGWFMKAVAPCVAYVGLRADEDEREGTRPGGDSAPAATESTQDFPFQRWGWGEEEVWAYLNDLGITIPDRTDCARCPFQKLGEWYNLWLNHRDIYASAMADEFRHGHTYRSDSRDTWPASLHLLAKRFNEGDIPERSLRMMDKRKGMCRACSL